MTKIYLTVENFGMETPYKKTLKQVACLRVKVLCTNLL
jgi:hypothetical protein